MFSFPSNHPLNPITSQPTPPPTSIPSLVYRVHRAGAQTRYDFATGFQAKNQTTIVNYTSGLSRFGLAHLNRQTNISSPFISVYSNAGHAEAVARHFASKYNEETFVVTIDTQHFARGPVFRAANLLALEGRQLSKEEEWLHEGEYLLMYKIPREAVRDQTPVGKAKEMKGNVGVIGGHRKSST